ncbi:hypothetical protein HDU93_001268 [Gonapodya sp. JEL0774]|nr:hypothetical protein HDU93_001268 [Gonapodya sp. JEL0774]
MTSRLVELFPLPQVYVLQNSVDDGTMSDGAFYPVHIICCTERGEVVRVVLSTEAFYAASRQDFETFPSYVVNYSIGAIVGDALLEDDGDGSSGALQMRGSGASGSRGGHTEDNRDGMLLLRYPKAFTCIDSDILLLGCDDGSLVVVRCPAGAGKKEYGDGRRYQGVSVAT